MFSIHRNKINLLTWTCEQNHQRDTDYTDPHNDQKTLNPESTLVLLRAHLNDQCSTSSNTQHDKYCMIL